MKSCLIPRRYRKHAITIINEFENSIGESDAPYKNWEEFLVFKYVGIQDGWISAKNKEYQYLKWLREINSFIRKVNSLME